VSPTREDYKPPIRYGVLLTAAVFVLLAAAYFARQELLLIYISGLLAVGFSPIVNFLERKRLLNGRRVPRWAAILAVYLSILLVVVVLGLLIIPTLVEQARQLYDDGPRYFQQAQQVLVDSGLLRRPMTVEEAVESVPPDANIARNVAWGVIGLFGAMLATLTVVILSFYFLVEGGTVLNGFVRFFPIERREEVRTTAHEITLRVSAWLTGQLLLAGLVGGITAVGLWLMGVPYFYVLALMAAVGEFIPYIGPLIAAVPAVALGFTESPRLGLGVVAFYVALQQLESYVLQPKIMSAKLDISPISVLIGVMIAYPLFGIIGVILAVPTTGIVMLIFDHTVAKD
jgi:predicted PurR-regulated permease PerM